MEGAAAPSIDLSLGGGCGGWAATGHGAAQLGRLAADGVGGARAATGVGVGSVYCEGALLCRARHASERGLRANIGTKSTHLTNPAEFCFSAITGVELVKG